MKKKAMNKGKKIRILAVSLLALLLIGAAGYTLFVKPALEQDEWVYLENAVEYGKLQIGVTETGTVAFADTTQLYDLDISTDDDDDDDEGTEKYLKIAEVFVAVGQRIREGDAIYRFTEDSVEDVRKALQHDKTEKEIALSQAQTEYEVGVLTAKLAYDENMTGASYADETYQNTIAKLQNQMTENALEIENLLCEILDLQLGLTDEDYLEERDDIVEAYDEAKENLDEDLEDFFTNSIDVQSAFKKAKESYDSFFDKMDESNKEITEKVDKVWELQAALERDQLLLKKEILLATQTKESSVTSGEIADSRYNSNVRNYQSALATAQEELDEATEKLDAFETFVGEGTVYASGSGIVTTVGYEKDDKLKTQGVLISYTKAEDMTIQVDIAQEDIVTMMIGEPVDIVFSAYKEEKYTGIVKSITTTSTSENAVTVSYPVVIAIEGDTSKLYSGMTADVTFLVDESEEVAYISKKAIVEQDHKKYVYQKTGEEYTLTEIETGFSDGINVEVTSGLKEGDTYYIARVVAKNIEENFEEEKKTDMSQTPIQTGGKSGS